MTELTLNRYVTADYERGNFSISQCSWVANAEQKVVAILPVSEASTSNSTSGTVGSTRSSSHVSVGAVAGSVVGGLAVLLALSLALWYFCIKPRRRRAEAEAAAAAAAKASESEHSTPAQPSSQEDAVFLKPELDNSEARRAAEMEDPIKNQWLVETDGNHIKPQNEMEGDSTPNIHEMHGMPNIHEMNGDGKRYYEMDGRRYVYPAEADGREVGIYELPAREEVAAEMMGRETFIPAQAQTARWSWATTPGPDVTSPGFPRGDVVSRFTPPVPGQEAGTGFPFGDIISPETPARRMANSTTSPSSEREEFPSPPISEQSPQSRRAYMTRRPR